MVSLGSRPSEQNLFTATKRANQRCYRIEISIREGVRVLILLSCAKKIGMAHMKPSRRTTTANFSWPIGGQCSVLARLFFPNPGRLYCNILHRSVTSSLWSVLFDACCICIYYMAGLTQQHHIHAEDAIFPQVARREPGGMANPHGTRQYSNT